MSIFSGPDEHAANPPSTWRVVRRENRGWHLTLSDDSVLETFSTKREALAAREGGFLFDLYGKESRWYAGDDIEGWKPYAEVAPAPAPAIRLTGLYDNGGETMDRYTALFEHVESGYRWYLGMSEHPFHPQGFGQHGEGDVSGTIERDTPIALTDAPPDVQRCIQQELDQAVTS